MAASFVGADGGYDDSEDGSEEGGGEGGSGAYGDAPFRFRTSEVAPWGEGDRPLIKVGGGGLEGMVSRTRVLSVAQSGERTMNQSTRFSFHQANRSMFW